MLKFTPPRSQCLPASELHAHRTRKVTRPVHSPSRLPISSPPVRTGGAQQNVVISPGAQTVINHSKLFKELILESQKHASSLHPSQVDNAKKRLAVAIGSILTKGNRCKVIEDLQPNFVNDDFDEISRVAQIGYLFRLKMQNTVLDGKRLQMAQRLDHLHRTIGFAVTDSIRFIEDLDA